MEFSRDDLPRLASAALLVEEMIRSAQDVQVNRLTDLATQGKLTGETALVFAGRMLGMRDVLIEIRAHDRKVRGQTPE